MISSKNNKQFRDGGLGQSVPSWRQKIIGLTTLYILTHSDLARKSGGSGPIEKSIRDVWRSRQREMKLDRH